jgi:3-oxoacyl-[acyl-carrier protein] reductase
MSKASSQPVALITGASRGIGRGIALGLAELNFSVVVNYASRRDAADEVVELIQSRGGKAIAVKANVGSLSENNQLVDATLEEFGRVDLLVNNAGITSPGRKDLLEATPENWDLVFDTNLKGPFFLTQRVANEMLALIEKNQIPGGKIINVSSISAFAASINRGDYCISKAAIGMLTNLFADRLAQHKILVYEILPGIIKSDMTGPVFEKYDNLIKNGMSPIARWGEPEDIAKAVQAIAQDYFPFSTGQKFHIDGGFHIRRL